MVYDPWSTSDVYLYQYIKWSEVVDVVISIECNTYSVPSFICVEGPSLYKYLYQSDILHTHTHYDTLEGNLNNPYRPSFFLGSVSSDHHFCIP